MWIGYYSPITRISEFVAGCIVAAIHSCNPRQAKRLDGMRSGLSHASPV